jgi:hypothetical protein
MHFNPRSTIPVIAIVFLSSCSARRGATDTGRCPINLKDYVRTTLYIGTSRYFAGDGWKRFTEDVLVKHLPAGGSVIENESGWWRRPDGSTAMGGGRLLIVLAPMHEIKAHRAGIQAVITEIKRVTGHLSVGLEEDRLCAAF